MNTLDKPLLQKTSWLSAFPITFFPVVMGLCGLTLATLKIETLFGYRHQWGNTLFIVSLLVFCGFSSIYFAKLIKYPRNILSEWSHPVKIVFFPTFSIGLILLGTAAQSLSATLSIALWGIGSVLHILLTIAVISMWLSKSHFTIEHVSPGWFMPVVGNILVPIAGVHYVSVEICWFYFSIGILFWLIVLNTVFNRLIFHPAMPGAMVPTFFIFLAPPSLSFISLVSITHEVGIFARILYYSATFLFLIILMQIPLLIRQTFSLSWWAYSFPVAAFTIATLTMAQAIDSAQLLIGGKCLFVALVIIVVSLAVRTLRGMLRNDFCKPEA